MAIDKPSYQMVFDLNLETAQEDTQQSWVSPEEAALREAEARTHFEFGEKPAWYEEYERLIYGNWPFRVAMYIAWAASPRESRYPIDLSGLASLMGLKSTRAIHVWRARNPEIDRQVTALQAAPLFKHRADAIAALVDSASDPDYRHAPDRRTFFTMTGDLDENVNFKMAGAKNDLSQMTDSELAALAAALKKGDSTSEEGDDK